MDKLDMSKEYSDRFDQLRRNRIEVGFYKYGPAHKNYSSGNIQAIPSMERCVKKYTETGNTEFLVDAANYLIQCVVKPLALAMGIQDTSIEFT